MLGENQCGNENCSDSFFEIGLCHGVARVFAMCVKSSFCHDKFTIFSLFDIGSFAILFSGESVA